MSKDDTPSRKMRFAPPYSEYLYTEIEGHKPQLVFVISEGPLKLIEHKIAEPLEPETIFEC